jgi:hypothetical protein
MNSFIGVCFAIILGSTTAVIVFGCGVLIYMFIDHIKSNTTKKEE